MAIVVMVAVVVLALMVAEVLVSAGVVIKASFEMLAIAVLSDLVIGTWIDILADVYISYLLIMFGVGADLLADVTIAFLDWFPVPYSADVLSGAVVDLVVGWCNN